MTVIAIVLAAVALRVAVAARHSLWADEVFSLAMATGHGLEHAAADAEPERGDFVERHGAVAPREYADLLRHERPPASPARVVRAVRRSDTSPPLYYLLLHGWTRVFGASDTALRLFSIACAMASLPFLLALARRAGGAPSMLALAALFAISPASIFYSVEGRMYSLVWLLVAAWLWATERLRARGLAPGALAVWTVAGAAGLWTHYFFLFGWSAGIAWILLRPGRIGRHVWLAGAAVVAASAIPWYRHIPELLSAWRVTGYWLHLEPADYRPFLTEAALFWSYFSVRGVWGGGTVWMYPGFVVYGTLAALAWRRVRRRPAAPGSAGLALSCVWAVAAAAGVVGFDVLSGTYAAAVPRYALAGLPAALLAAAVAFGIVGARARGVLLAAALLLFLIGARRVWLDAHRQGSAYREIGEMLALEARPGDVAIVHSIPSGVCGVARYIEAARAAAEARDEARDRDTPPLAAWVGQLGARRVPQDLETLIEGRARVLLVYVHAVGDEPLPYRWLLENATKIETRVFADGAVHVFEPREGETFERRESRGK